MHTTQNMLWDRGGPPLRLGGSTSHRIDDWFGTEIIFLQMRIEYQIMWCSKRYVFKNVTFFKFYPKPKNEFPSQKVQLLPLSILENRDYLYGRKNPVLPGNLSKFILLPVLESRLHVYVYSRGRQSY
jgi:hypothetical protein